VDGEERRQLAVRPTTARLPNARMLSWGYDANALDRFRVSSQYLYDHSRSLVSDLCFDRQLTHVRDEESTGENSRRRPRRTSLDLAVNVLCDIYEHPIPKRQRRRASQARGQRGVSVRSG
jgi:hypothetical protein